MKKHKKIEFEMGKMTELSLSDKQARHVLMHFVGGLSVMAKLNDTTISQALKRAVLDSIRKVGN